MEAKEEDRADENASEESEDEGETPCGTNPKKKELILQKKLKSGACCKCRTTSASLVWRKDVCCWDCFIKIFSRRFKSSFTKVRAHKREKVRLLLAFSGGNTSRALLHCVATCIQGRGVKDFFDVQVIYIEEGVALGTVATESEGRCASMREIVEEYGLPFHVISLAYVYSTTREVQEEDCQKLLESFKGIGSQTAKEDLLTYLRTVLLVRVAKERGFHKIITGESATHFAVHMISSTCKGRGFGLADELQLVDSRFESDDGVIFLRPMKDFLAKEIALFNHFHRLRVVPGLWLETRSAKKSSINQLSEDFLAGLQTDFPHTIHTLLRCGDKLSQITTPETRHCPLCASPLTESELRQDMVCSVTTTQKRQGACGAGECGCSTNNESCSATTTIQSKPLLCYGCARLLSETPAGTSPLQLLPPDVVHKVEAVSRAVQLRQTIAEYLLAEN